MILDTVRDVSMLILVHQQFKIGTIDIVPSNIPEHFWLVIESNKRKKERNLQWLLFMHRTLYPLC